MSLRDCEHARFDSRDEHARRLGLRLRLGLGVVVVVALVANPCSFGISALNIRVCVRECAFFSFCLGLFYALFGTWTEAEDVVACG